MKIISISEALTVFAAKPTDSAGQNKAITAEEAVETIKTEEKQEA